MAKTVGFQRQKVVAAFEELGVRTKDGRLNKFDIESIFQKEFQNTCIPKSLGTSLLEHTNWCQQNPRVATLLRQNLEMREFLRSTVAKMHANAEELKGLAVKSMPVEASVEEFQTVQSELQIALTQILHELKLKIG